MYNKNTCSIGGFRCDNDMDSAIQMLYIYNHLIVLTKAIILDT